jgi:hypothetical protein
MCGCEENHPGTRCRGLGCSCHISDSSEQNAVRIPIQAGPAIVGEGILFADGSLGISLLPNEILMEVFRRVSSGDILGLNLDPVVKVTLNERNDLNG